MPPSALYDRAIALACTLPALRRHWLFVQCPCGASHQRPIHLTLLEEPKAARWTLADLVVRMRCRQCRGRDVTVMLVEDHRIPEEVQEPPTAGPIAGWSLLLHGAARCCQRP